MSTRAPSVLRLVPAPAGETPTAEPGDPELVVRALRADERAVELLFRRYAPSVIALATRLLRDRVEAEDVAQETFLIALGSLDTLRDPSAVRAWLFQVAVRQVHRRFRRQRLLRALGLAPRRNEASGAVTGLDELASADASPETRSELALLDHTLSQLDVESRTAWVLRFVEGLKLEEVAEACGCSLATVKRRIGAADERVRERVRLEVEAADER